MSGSRSPVGAGDLVEPLPAFPTAAGKWAEPPETSVATLFDKPATVDVPPHPLMKAINIGEITRAENEATPGKRFIISPAWNILRFLILALD